MQMQVFLIQMQMMQEVQMRYFQMQMHLYLSPTLVLIRAKSSGYVGLIYTHQLQL